MKKEDKEMIEALKIIKSYCSKAGIHCENCNENLKSICTQDWTISPANWEVKE